MKATILHDEHGRILAISKVGDLKKSGSKFDRVGMVPGAGQWKLDVELSADHEKRPLRELHTEFRVDVASSKLVKKENS